MAKNTVPRGETSVIRHVFIMDSTSTTGAGKTALAYDTASLTAYYIYPGGTAASLTLETISTLGTYAAPTSAAHLRFKKIDDTNMPGWYELQFHNDWFSVANARRAACVQLKGATGMAPLNLEIDCIGTEIQSATPSVNSTQISGSATAANNVELIYDTDVATAYNTTRKAWATNVQDFVGTTGSDPFAGKVVSASVTGNINTAAGTIQTLDALDTAQDAQHLVTQAAIAGIGSGTGAALNFACTTDSGETDPLNSVSKVGTVPSATEYIKTTADNAVYEVITAAANAIDWVYKFSVGGGRVASKITFNGYLLVGGPVGTKAVNVYAWDWTGTPAWDLVAVIGGQTGTTDVTRDITLLSSYTGTGANAGIIYLRFTNAGAVTSLNVDALIAQAQNLGQTVGYQDGCVWVDATGGTAGTTPFVNGTADNACTTIADAYTIAAAVGLTGIDVAPGTTLTLTASADKWHFQGGGRIALGSQSTADAKFLDIYTVSGITSGDDQVFIRCGIGDVTIPHCYCLDCRMKGDFTTTASQVYYWLDCSDANESADTQTVIFAAGAKLYARRWSGALTVKNMVAGNELIVDGAGRIVIDSTCTGGTINIRGNFPPVTDNVVGGFTVAGGTITQSARYATDQINTECDTALSDIDLDHWTKNGTAVPAFTAGTYLDQMLDDGTEAYDRTTDSLQAVRDHATTIKTDTGNIASRITANLFTGITYLKNWLGALAGKTADTVTRAEINATTAGAGYNETTDSLEANRDNIGTAGAGLTSVSGLTVAQANSLAAIEADTNELQTDWTNGGRLDSILDTAAGASGGTGARTVTVTVNDGATALQSARVRMTKGAESYAQTTSALGIATFNLDDGTWTVAITLGGYTYAGTTLVVDGTESVTYSMTAASFTPSTQPSTVTVRWTVIDHADGLPVGAAEATVYMKLVTPPTTDGFAWGKSERTDTTDANGRVEFTNVPIGSTIKARLGSTGEWYELAIPATATSPYDAGEILGVVG